MAFATITREDTENLATISRTNTDNLRSIGRAGMTWEDMQAPMDWIALKTITWADLKGENWSSISRAS